MSINVVSLFSGGGGLDLGFIAEGYNIIFSAIYGVQIGGAR